MWYASSGTLNWARLALKKSVTALIGDCDLCPDFLLDDLLRQHFAPEPVPHVLRRKVSTRQFLLERVVGEVFLGVVVGGVEVALSNLDFQRGRLRQQDVLDDDVIEDGQLGCQGLLIGQRLRLVPRSPEDLVDVGCGDCLAIDDGPGVGCHRHGGRWGPSCRAAGRAGGRCGQHGQKDEKKAILASEG